MKKYLLAIDQGTTSCRAILFDKSGEVINIFQKEFKQIYPQQGWVEHDPTEIIDSQKEVLLKLLENTKISPSEIISIGITNQRETIVVWNRKTGEPIYNAIVWQDTRTAEFCKEINADFELSDYIQGQTGLIVDSYFSGSKIKWILDNYPGSKADLILGTIDTWLLWNLSDEKLHATDYSNASRTMLFNIKELKWDDKLCDFFGIEKSMLPTVMDSASNYGNITVRGVKIPVGAMIGDQQSALFGQTCFNPGDSKNTYGTGCFMLMNTGEQIKISDNGLLTTIGWGINGKITYALEGSIFIAGAAIQWLRDEIEIIESATETCDMAKRSKQNNLVFVPAFAGLGAPHWDESARGLIVGLTRDTNKDDIAKATLKSLAFQTKEVFDLMEKESGIELKELKVDGGASQNDYLMQFQSNILNTEVIRAKNPEITARGAALLSAVGVGELAIAQLEKLGSAKNSFIPSFSQESIDKEFDTWRKAVELCKGWLE